jgi:hypothetical protein
MTSIGLLTFSIGLLLCGMALVGELFNVVGRQRQAVEGFEWHLINLVNLLFLGTGLISFYIWFSMIYE